ncbi:hypothetical protein CICLE_v100243852mg, partial [Citrus x clementina]
IFSVEIIDTRYELRLLALYR